jgi:hypothetical protein
MSEFPKYFVKGGKTKTAHNPSEAVAAKFAGWRPAPQEPTTIVVTPTSEEPPQAHQELVNKLLPEADENKVASDAVESDETKTAPKPQAPRKS